MQEHFHELLVLNTSVLTAIENITDVPYVVYFEECDYEKIIETLKRWCLKPEVRENAPASPPDV